MVHCSCKRRVALVILQRRDTLFTLGSPSKGQQERRQMKRTTETSWQFGWCFFSDTEFI